MKWIPLSERKPTREDGDSVGEVLWRFFSRVDGTDASCVGKWDDPLWLEQSTHFARIRDIELPPPAPVMPERIEYVRVPDSEELAHGMLGFELNSSTPFGIYHENKRLDWLATDVVFYRRVEPGKRIVFEVVGESVPKQGELLIARDHVSIITASIDYTPGELRTILRCVEGEEYLK